eukprot:m.81792 g.81792  ORF g.81792 m.81792 type:complete len:55 (-) comp19501_c0_seq2:1735-1899(-)
METDATDRGSSLDSIPASVNPDTPAPQIAILMFLDGECESDHPGYCGAVTGARR